MNTASCIILTFKEWTNWVTFGLLRNSQRIRAYTGTQKSFNDLLGITPDITHLEDNSLLLPNYVTLIIDIFIKMII